MMQFTMKNRISESFVSEHEIFVCMSLRLKKWNGSNQRKDNVLVGYLNNWHRYQKLYGFDQLL